MQSGRKELIRTALMERLGQLRSERIAALRPQDFGAHAPFVSELQARISALSMEAASAGYHQPTTDAGGWTEWAGDCLEALRRLALGEALTTTSSAAVPVEPFLASLYEVRRKPHERFRLLVERYACPLNITRDGEREVREHLLERLMVQDRALVESGHMDGVSVDDVLLKLNLLAVYAARSEDLRYLDALNYYYEFHERLNPAGTQKWLLASYLGLYAGALIAWLNQRL
ncbi:MAG TPA: hypothetical protein VEQ40_08885 [Pyrinomonadaceae bacterium]|nr:hypothetical protein [Pyrinomonadaceae bacterium]